MIKKARKQAAGKETAAKQSNSKTPEKAVRASVRKETSAQKATPAKRTSVQVAAEPLTHKLDALLHTMRSIAQHEDELCTLLHDARRTGRVSSTLLRELQAVLAALPAQEYTDDLEAVRQITA